MICDETFTLQTTDDEGARTLATYWQKVFARKPLNTEAIAKLLPFAPKYSIGLLMDKESMAARISRSKSNAPGMDGVPNTAWKALGDVATNILFRAAECFADGVDLPASHRESRFCFLMKEDPMVIETEKATCRAPSGRSH